MATNQNQSLMEVVAASIENDMATIAKSNKSTKASASKKETKKEQKTEEAPTPETTSKKETKKETKKEKVTKDVVRAQNTAILETVLSTREVKYLYPADVQDTVTRKRWRQAVRNKLHQLEREMYRIQDKESKEYKKALKAYEDYRKTVLKPSMTA